MPDVIVPPAPAPEPGPTPPMRLSTAPKHAPGAGGWVPHKRTPLWAALAIGVITSAAPAVVVAVPAPWNAIVAATLAGIGGTLGTYFSMKSAGPRKS